MMKWRVRRDSHCNSIEHEEVRRSLEVLDSVLAEFDDCLDTWESSTDITGSLKKLKSRDINGNGWMTNGRTSPLGSSFQKESTDGSTLQHSFSHFPEQKVSFPPPIPTRSPSTRLSEKEALDDASLDSYDDVICDLSGTAEISGLLSHPESDKDHSRCSHCGLTLQEEEMTEEVGGLSPFLLRKQAFEARIAEASSATTRSYSGSVRRKKVPVTEDSSSGPASLPANGWSALDSMSKSVPTSAQKRCRIEGCDCEDRIQRLDALYSETRSLLKMKKLKGLDREPPSFVPAAPPSVGRETHSLPKPTDFLPKISTDTDQNSLGNYDESYAADVSGNCDASPRLCQRCSAHLNETIEDLLHLLPTDALNRPQLGLSYSLEDDLSPGVKELRPVFDVGLLRTKECSASKRKTSTPKTDASSASLFKTSSSANEIHGMSSKDSQLGRTQKEESVGLSTFNSQSASSSLGYVSSQSDLELNAVPDKVPVSSFKSMTLPNGLDRSPFYSAEEETPGDRAPQHDYNDHRLSRDSKSTEDLLLRSASAPPPPDAEKAKKRHFRAFSRKDKKKNADNISLKSDISLDEEIILRNLSTLDGSTISSDSTPAHKTECGVEKKRRSMWRSILGKKQT